MEWLRLGLLGLPDAEVRLAATLFRLHQVEPSFIWRLSTEPPFDAVLADASVSDQALVKFCGPRTQVKRLAERGVSDPEFLTRPLRSDRLIDWLNTIEVQLLHGSADHFASTVAPSRQGLSVAPGSPALASSGASSPGSVDAVYAWLEKLSDETLAVKLRRWPPATLLGKDVSRIRIATMISRRAMSLAEVSALARVPQAICQGFLAALGEKGYLQTKVVESPPTPVAETVSTNTPEPAPRTSARPGFGASLLRSIRKRFGIA